MADNSNQTELHHFLSRLDADSTSGLIRDVIRATRIGQGHDLFSSDPWDDMHVGYDFPDFYINDYKLPLVQMKKELYEWLEIVRPGSKEYIDDIEDTDPVSLEKGWLLKFKKVSDGSGKQVNSCESLGSSFRPLCFIQYCRYEKCSYMIKQIDRALNARWWYDRKVFKRKKDNILVEISPPWLKVRNFSNSNYMGVPLESAKQFIQEWMEFIKE